MEKLIVYFLLVLSFFSCKKEKESNNIDTSNEIDCSQSEPEPSVIYGVLEAERFSVLKKGVLTQEVGYDLLVAFSPTPYNDETEHGYPVNTVDGGNVSCNGDSLRKSTGINPIYINYDTSTPNPPFNWVVQGSVDVPGFTYKNCKVSPSYSGYNLLPDTINMNQDLVIRLEGVSDVDAIYAEIGGYSTPKILLSSTNTFTVSSSNLLQNPPNQWQQYVRLIFHKRSYITKNNKSYKISSNYQFTKDSVKFITQ